MIIRGGTVVTARGAEKADIAIAGDQITAVGLNLADDGEASENQEAVRDWYVKTFGATAGKRGQFPAAFIPGGEVDVMKATAAPVATKGRALDHIGFEVKNLEAFTKKLEADGIKLDRPYTKVAALDIGIAFITDPWGTSIELTEGLDRVR